MESTQHRAGKYLTFRVGRRDFAMNAGCVSGVLPLHELAVATPDATQLPWLAGYATLHGRHFPVVNLRAKLGVPDGSQGREPCIVVIEAGARIAGFIADRVSEVVDARGRDFRQGRLRIGRPRQVIDPETVFGRVEQRPSP